MTDVDEASECDAPLDYPKTLRFTLATGEEQFDAAIADAEAAESGEEVGTEAVRAFDSVADLRALLTDRRLQVLRSIHEEPPDSISALADRLDRPYAVVHEDVHTLASHDVVRFTDGPRGAKRPFVPYESVRVDVPLVGPTGVPDLIGLRG
jgi:predicted transcriptional regulator